MLDIDIIDRHDTAKAVRTFHRDGFVAVSGLFTAEQLARMQDGARRVIAEQTSAIALEQANRGFARYSFGSQIHHPEWAILVDVPEVLAILDGIWGPDYHCTGGGGDYSLPGARIQGLHSDLPDFLKDPLGQVTVRDLPTPFIVMNVTMIDFTVANGAIRFVPGTQRSRAPIPSLDEEPEWMRNQQLCAPAGTAIIRDVRCWHGGTANRSDQVRPMTSVGYYAGWMRSTHRERPMPTEVYRALSPRGQQLCAAITELDATRQPVEVCA